MSKHEPTLAETLKQAMDDWDRATPEQRAEASAYAASTASAAARALRAIPSEARTQASRINARKGGRKPGPGHVPDPARAKAGRVRGYALCGVYARFRDDEPACPTCLWLQSTLRKGVERVQHSPDPST
jgi:hypothetical protein